MAGESGPTEVNIGECRCPGTPHAAGDVVWLRSRPDLNMGLAAQEALRQSGNLRGDSQAALLSVLVRYGVAAWNCRDDDGPIRVTTDAVMERLGWGEAALAVAAKAKELFWDTVLAPLVPARPEPQSPTPDSSSTSQSPESGPPIPISSGPRSPSEPVAGKRSATTGA